MLKYFLVLGWVASLAPVASAGEDDVSKRAPFPSPRHSGEGRIAFSSSNVQLLGWLPLSEFGVGGAGSGTGNDVWGYSSPSGREYAIVGMNNGTGFVEVTDPGKPTLVGFISGVTNFWRCIKVYDDYAYAGSEGGGGIQVFNLTNIDSGSVTLQATVTSGGCSTATHTLAIDTTSAFLYRAGGSGSCGVNIYSLANPALPSFVGSWNNRYVHECQVETWPVAGPHLGKQIAFCYTQTGSGGGDPRLTILDVTDKGAIVQLASVSYSGAQFSHQGWTSADKQYLYLNDEQDDGIFGASRTRIFDLADLAAPSYLGFFTSGAASIDHNLYVKNNQITESNYTSGLRVFDNTVPTAPTQIGFFDTWPENDAFGFNSLWSNYPYFASGTIVGGDIEKGLWIWRVGAPTLTFNFPNGTPELIGPSGSVIQFEVDQALAGDLQSGTEQLHYSTGGAFNTINATWLGGNDYEAVLPAFPCGAHVQYYVSAQSIDGVTWTDPPAGPTQVYNAIAAAAVNAAFSETFQNANASWQVNVAADLTGFGTATTGTWTRTDPIGTAAQPEDDHTSGAGTNCWFTGQGSAGGGEGDADVDLGATSLRSAVLDASGVIDPHISYWRWYSNNFNGVIDDTMTVHVSNNGGTNWVLVETLGPSGPDCVGGWIKHDFRIADFVTPTNDMRLRFRASDLGSGSIVEAAIDDLEIVDYACAVTVTSISQASGPFNGGNVVTINGTDFVSGMTTVRFGLNQATVNVLSSTTIQASVPPALSPNLGKFRSSAQTVDVVVENPGSDTLVGGYTYQPPPLRTQ